MNHIFDQLVTEQGLFFWCRHCGCLPGSLAASKNCGDCLRRENEAELPTPDVSDPVEDALHNALKLQIALKSLDIPIKLEDLVAGIKLLGLEPVNKMLEKSMRDALRVARSSLAIVAHSMTDLLAGIRKAQLDPLDEGILKDYTLPDRRQRRYSAEDTSTVVSNSSSTQFNMCQFEICDLHHDSRPRMTTLKVDTKKLEEYIFKQLDFKDMISFNSFMAEACGTLRSLRQMLVHVRQMNVGCDELSFLQPVYVMFLDWIFEKLQLPWEASKGQNLPLELDLLASGDSAPTAVEVCGATDVVVSIAESEGFDGIKFINELKMPFGKLHRPQSTQHKDQLVLELMGVRKLMTASTTVCGCLTDMFSITCSFNFVGDDSHFYMLGGVVAEREFMLRLLLLLCKESLTESELHGLTASRGRGTRAPSQYPPTHTRSKGSSRRGRKAGLDSKSFQAKQNKTDAWNITTSRSGQLGYELIITPEHREELEREFDVWFARYHKCIPLTVRNLEEWCAL